MSSSIANEEMNKPAHWWRSIGPTTTPTRRKRNPSQYPTSTPTRPETSPTASLPSYRTGNPSNDADCYDCPPSSLPDDDCVSPQKSRPPMIRKEPPKIPPSEDNPKPKPKPRPEYSDDDNQSIDDEVDHNYNDGTGSTGKKPQPKGKPKSSAVRNDPLSLFHL